MTTRVEKGKSLLEKVQSRTGLSDDGKHWLISAFDPMHDERLKTAGYPDRQNGASIVQTVKQTKTISKPPAIAGTWNCTIVADNDLKRGTALRHTVTNGALEAQAALSYIPTGGLTIVAGDGVVDHLVEPGHGYDLGGFDVSGQIVGKSRILGVGFEVVNTTPDLYKSGAILVWEQPFSLERDSSYEYWVPTTGQANTVSLLPDSLIPQTTASAALLQGTQVWDAKLGAYAVLNMCQMDNPPIYPHPIQKLQTEHETHGPLLTAGTYAAWTNVLVDSTMNHMFTAENHQIIPYNRKGFMLTGLSAETTLAINYNVVIETFPTQTNPQLAVLATPTSCYDPVAFELYSEIACKLPVAVKFADNDLGDWFLAVADTAVNAISSIGKPILAATQSYQKVRNQQNPKPVQARAEQPANMWKSGGNVPKQQQNTKQAKPSKNKKRNVVNNIQTFPAPVRVKNN